MSKKETASGMSGISEKEANVELAALRAVKSSPFATQLVSHTEDKHNAYLLMECCCCDLFSLMREAENSGNSLGTKRTQFILAQVVDVLDTLHNSGFMYRDLKPENILVGADGFVQLCDFGSCFQQSHANERSKTQVGTVEYQAPEQLNGQLHSRAIDFWSLGCLLYDITCQQPFADAEDDDDVRDMILDYVKTGVLPWLNGEKKVRVAASTKELVEKLLVPDPRRRLGMGPEGADEIRSAPFFSSIDWVFSSSS